MKTYAKSQAGQIVLILVLLTVVGVTVGLSLIARTVTDVRISSQIEESTRAFSAAEAGVETALKGAVVGGPTGIITLPGASANFSVSGIGGKDDPVYFPSVPVGGTQTIWLIGHKADGSIDEASYSLPANQRFDICWGTADTPPPALALTLLYKEGTEYKLAKIGYDPSRRGNFYDVDGEVGGYCGGNYKYVQTIRAANPPPGGLGIPVVTILLELRIEVVYEDTALAIDPNPGVVVPDQGKQITSVGQTETNVVRKIQVNQGYVTLPEIFNFALFSAN